LGTRIFNHSKGIIGLVLNAKKEFGTEQSVKVEPDGRQMAMLKIASKGGGFVVPAYTPSGSSQSR